ncbi:MAG: hypothetical protein A2700_01155 [Candidatus Blackburnbacteria bacterium RIFCSPHIGHO2_01_FULL_44_64]|uniref:Uncharacterized protein n=1 Tax=Candidatus Blackburnbacteria bacterium RIFCSPHIGHO2_02_FULL_44_20 TaxID=1797516 RepID=A0A1G1V8R0_9BACT|nr:MAG: hypothetical protein A2700_01155 [Candidatus Blackburnbacteria bacterium RIFCSPHIGHO2_01_FULL_44_64]OGY11588.1 MAG: hypothetical protein A3E16_04550 [Candidatus Blackburnbacteria bacterium RIFCSPHIGHO2_12_FULL_44_25]OGY11687.1 MAG: hypothetical protein A3D26_01065 [Candidatus Blackburnbacteria bacterium RIFCSPHIGHO2_02_FULL_44_20]OGY14387.1 MAG: hypothetical protein A3A62_03500 [Candidatus Blackburnbacteria bacterium RIFCSPLOWO2_01_FULL_44_43]OGY17412.1 MAG: hypothetical protein A3H88_0
MAIRPVKFLNRASWKSYSRAFVSGAVIAVLLAGLGYFGTDIWLASTQWLLVAAVLAAFGVYSKLES